MSERGVESSFHSPFYLRHNQRRLEHLASLRLPLREATVLDVGAGIGDHTSFFVDRDCEVTAIEGRPENVQILARTFPAVTSVQFDMDAPDPSFTREFDIVYCYGLLYHLRNPSNAIDWMAKRCRKLLLLETCVSYGEGKLIHLCTEDKERRTQAFSGTGCRPTRDWVLAQLREHFEYAYVTLSQPNHEEFPTDWTASPVPNRLSRSVFVASRSRLCNDLLTEIVPLRQSRH